MIQSHNMPLLPQVSTYTIHDMQQAVNASHRLTQSPTYLVYGIVHCRKSDESHCITRFLLVTTLNTRRSLLVKTVLLLFYIYDLKKFITGRYLFRRLFRILNQELVHASNNFSATRFEKLNSFYHSIIKTLLAVHN